MSSGFILFGNGSSGTSLLQRILNAHPKVTCEFEPPTTHDHEQDIAGFEERAEKAREEGLLWGVKLVFEQTLDWRGKWSGEALHHLCKRFDLVFVSRSFEGYYRSWNRRQSPQVSVEQAFSRHRSCVRAVREVFMSRPGNLYWISFEALLLDPLTILKGLGQWLAIQDLERVPANNGIIFDRSRVIGGHLHK